MSFAMFRRASFGTFDPRDLPRSLVATASLQRTWNASTSNATFVAFFTGATNSLNRMGASAINSAAWTADTYKTLCDITGVGFLSGIIGPCGGGSITFTPKITVDGIPFTLTSFVTGNSGRRPVIGALIPLNYFGGGSATAGQSINQANAEAATDSGLTTDHSNQTNMLVSSPTEALMHGFPVLRFSRSLKVELKTAGAVNDGGNNEQYSAVLVARGE